jgi:hypothetical protein
MNVGYRSEIDGILVDDLQLCVDPSRPGISAAVDVKGIEHIWLALRPVVLAILRSVWVKTRHRRGTSPPDHPWISTPG